jgi:hypothetical protein
VENIRTGLNQAVPISTEKLTPCCGPGQAASTHGSTIKLTSCWKEKADRSGRAHTSIEEKLTSCWKQKVDRSGSGHTSIEEKIHFLLDGKSRPVRQGPHIDQRKTHVLLEEKAERSSGADTLTNEKPHRLLEEKSGPVRQCPRVDQGENSPPVG